MSDTKLVEENNTLTNKRRLLCAAVEVFAERGYEKAGVAEIARRADLTTGAIYSRYRGKADLLVEALDDELVGHLEAVFSAPDFDNSPTGALSLLGNHLIGEDNTLTNAVFLEAVVAARHKPELAEMLESALEGERMRLSKIIEEAKDSGLFDDELDTHAVLTFIQAIGLGFAVFRSIGTPMPDPASWQLVIERVIAAAQPSEDSKL